MPKMMFGVHNNAPYPETCCCLLYESSKMLKNAITLASSCCYYVQVESRDVQVLQYFCVIWAVFPTSVKLRE